MTRYGLVFNLDSCSDHRSCMIACKAKTQSFLGSHFVETYTSMAGEYPNPQTYFIPICCQHCANPACAPACDKGVFTKREDGIVAVGDTAVCASCESKACVSACPYSAIDLDPTTGLIGKCDLCADLIDAGETPACSRGCYSRSIFFGDLDDPSSVVSQAIEAWSAVGYVHQLKPETGNEPGVYYLLSKREWRDMEGLYSPAWHNE
jgi:Fe-S-cluster-containing dehydrogenase component